MWLDYAKCFGYVCGRRACVVSSCVVQWMQPVAGKKRDECRVPKNLYSLSLCAGTVVTATGKIMTEGQAQCLDALLFNEGPG